MFGTQIFGQAIFGQTTSGRTILPKPVRLITDEDIRKAINDGQIYFELYFYSDRDTSITSVSTSLEMDRALSLYKTLKAPTSHLWLMVPRFWCESEAKPTSLDDMYRIQELFVPINKVMTVS